jgi:hypothetical protein
MLEIKINDQLLKDMLGTAKDQLPYAASVAINLVSAAAMRQMREDLPKRLDIQQSWVLSGFKILTAATKKTLVAYVGIDPSRNFLSWFEKGGERGPLHGMYNWIPNAEVFKNKTIKSSNPLYPANIRLDNGVDVSKNIYMIRRNTSVPLVLQYNDGKRKRKGVEQGDARLLYTLVKKSTMPLSLQFYDTVNKVIMRDWESIATIAAARALKPKGA